MGENNENTTSYPAPIDELHYYKVVSEFDNAKYIWYENILYSDINVNCEFSGKIRIVPITKEEGQTLYDDLKENGIPELVSNVNSSEYVYNKWQKFDCSFYRNDFLLCDYRKKLERMSWRTALYLACNMFVINVPNNREHIIDKFRTLYQPYHDVLSYSIMPNGEIILHVVSGTKLCCPLWSEVKLYFLVKKSIAKTGDVIKFKEFEYYNVHASSIKAIEETANYLAENNRKSTYTYKQVFLNENNDSSSSESDSLDNDSSSSAIDGWIGKQPDYYVGVIKMGRIIRLKKDDDNESSITTRTKIKTAGRLGGATVVIGGSVISFRERDGGGSGGGEVQREFKYRKVDGTEQLYKFQVSGVGLVDFLNFGSDNPDLVYPLVAKKDMNGNNVDDKEYHLQLPLISNDIRSEFFYPFIGKYNGLYIYNTNLKTCGISVIEDDNNKVWEYCIPNENDTETEYELQKIYEAKKVSNGVIISEPENRPVIIPSSNIVVNTEIQNDKVNSFTYETGEFISL